MALHESPYTWERKKIIVKRSSIETIKINLSNGNLWTIYMNHTFTDIFLLETICLNLPLGKCILYTKQQSLCLLAFTSSSTDWASAWISNIIYHACFSPPDKCYYRVVNWHIEHLDSTKNSWFIQSLHNCALAIQRLYCVCLLLCAPSRYLRGQAPGLGKFHRMQHPWQ